MPDKKGMRRSTLLSEAVEMTQRKKDASHRCTFYDSVSKLPEGDRIELKKALADPTVPATALAAVLRRRGVTTTSWTIRRHVKNECGFCGRMSRERKTR